MERSLPGSVSASACDHRRRRGRRAADEIRGLAAALPEAAAQVEADLEDEAAQLERGDADATYKVTSLIAEAGSAMEDYLEADANARALGAQIQQAKAYRLYEQAAEEEARAGRVVAEMRLAREQAGRDAEATEVEKRKATLDKQREARRVQLAECDAELESGIESTWEAGEATQRTARNMTSAQDAAAAAQRLRTDADRAHKKQLEEEAASKATEEELKLKIEAMSK